MRHRLVPLLGFFALCGLLAGCGGSSGPTATATTNAAAATTAPVATATAAPLPTASAPAARIPTATPAGAPTSAAPAIGGNTIAVELKDYAITLSPSTASAGMVTFNVRNSGPSAHNFNVRMGDEEKGVMTLDPGKTATLTLDLKAGSYDFRCNVPAHSLLGMKGTLTVK